jgi:membrane protease YdiL (CAAX protease family)
VSLLPLFVDSDYEVRSGWKFAAYSAVLVLLFYAAGMALGILAIWLDPTLVLMSHDDIRFLALNAAVLFVPATGALLVMARFVDRVPISAFGVLLHQGWMRDFGVGVLLAAGMMAIVVAGTLPFGSIHVQWIASSAALPAIGGTLVVLLVSALNEELVFRGYPFQIFLRGLGPAGAMLLISFVWALLHVRNDGATLLSTINTVIAGVFFCRAYMETRSLWLPFGIHVGWNVGTAMVLGIPVSGIDTASLMRTQMTGPALIVGGSYGPENSILGTIVFLAGAIVVRRLHIGKVSPEVRAALNKNADKVYIEKS